MALKNTGSNRKACRYAFSGYVDLVAKKLSVANNDIINPGLVDTPDKAFAKDQQFRYSELIPFYMAEGESVDGPML